MKIEEVIDNMSKLYLHRTLESFLKDIKKPDEEESRKLILKNLSTLVSKDRVHMKLDFMPMEWDMRILGPMILKILLHTPGYALDEDAIIKITREFEKRVVKEAKDNLTVWRSNQEKLNLFSNVLNAAWNKDSDLNAHEEFILTTLKQELSVTDHERRVLEVKINRWPTQHNKLHTDRDIENALKELQLRGLVMRMRDHNKGVFVIPDELATTIRDYMTIELQLDTYPILLDRLPKKYLERFLKQAGLPVSGTKEEIGKRIIEARFRPSEVLNLMGDEDLRQVLVGLPDAKVSGTKKEKVDRIISYFDQLNSHEDKEPEDPRSLAYQYLEELARRDRVQLNGNRIIKKDIEMERMFEHGTTYLFEKKLGHQTELFHGSDHADGKIIFNSDKIVLWDNKSCEKEFCLDETIFKQFKRYIQDEGEKVTLFLVIAPEFDDKAESQAYRLKMEFNYPDLDVALITAKDLKWLAENWRAIAKKGDAEQLNLSVLDYTGVIGLKDIKNRLRWA